MTLTEVHSLGLDAAQGLVLTEGFYWDHDDQSRAFSERFFKRTGRMPSMIHAGTYSATLSYLKAVKSAGTKDVEAVAKTGASLDGTPDIAAWDCGAVFFSLEKPHEAQKVRKFPVLFPVSSELDLEIGFPWLSLPKPRY